MLTFFETHAARSLTQALRRGSRWLPHSRHGDALFLLLDFVWTHGRLPRHRDRFNDHLFRLCTSSEIMDVCRQFTSDKELAKLYATGVLGEDVSVPTLGVLHTKEEVERFSFPSSCVIKPTHSSGQIIVRKNGEPIDRSVVAGWLEESHYVASRGGNLRYLRPKIIVEPVLFGGGNVDDYKVFCMDGTAKAILYVRDRYKDFSRALFDLEWNMMNNARLQSRLPDPIPERPAVLGRVLSVAEALSARFGLVRVDFFIDGEEWYLGEITHVHMRGLEKFQSEADHIEFSRAIFSPAS